MDGVNMKYTLFFSLLLIGCGNVSTVSTLQEPNVTPEKGQASLNLVIPSDPWEPIFFKEINQLAKIAGLQNLRSVALPSGDLEVRIWGGFGEDFTQGLILKRTTGQWSALHLVRVHPKLPKSQYQIVRPSPKSGWEKCWERLIKEGLLTLPDSSTLKGEKNIRDGFSYVVEINKDRTYRTYMYSNPDQQDWREAKQMVRVGQILSDEFGFPSHQ
jgi:hypothetical protein